jgi:hypothetical protein
VFPEELQPTHHDAVRDGHVDRVMLSARCRQRRERAAGDASQLVGPARAIARPNVRMLRRVKHVHPWYRHPAPQPRQRHVLDNSRERSIRTSTRYGT